MAKAKKSGLALDGISKCPTGNQGLEEVSFGGLPRGRPTLVCGGAGCGKTLLGMEFLVRGAMQHNEPGVCISFEETGQELAQNMRSLGFNINALILLMPRALAEPVRKMIGDLSNTERVLVGLDLRPRA